MRRINRDACKAWGKPLGGKFGKAGRELDRPALPVHDDDRVIDSLRHLRLKCLLAPPALGLPARLPLAPDAAPSSVGGETKAAGDLSQELPPRVFAADPGDVGDIDPIWYIRRLCLQRRGLWF